MIVNMIYAMLVMIPVVVGGIFLVNTRGARIRRFARAANMRYEPRLEAVLTPEAQQASLFFQQEVHHFHHVLTFHEPGAFMRLCEDRIFSSNTATAPYKSYTLITAELTRESFTPLILMPRRPNQTAAPHPALPAQLAQKYVLSASYKYQLPDVVIGFLQATRPCYLELTPGALIYHEFGCIPVAEIQNMRFRARQLVRALVNKPAVDPAATQTYIPSVESEAQIQALALLKMQSASRSYSRAAGQSSGAGRWIYGLIFLMMILGMCLATAYFLPQWVHK